MIFPAPSHQSRWGCHWENFSFYLCLGAFVNGSKEWFGDDALETFFEKPEERKYKRKPQKRGDGDRKIIKMALAVLKGNK